MTWVFYKMVWRIEQINDMAWYSTSQIQVYSQFIDLSGISLVYFDTLIFSKLSSFFFCYGKKRNIDFNAIMNKPVFKRLNA